MTIVTITSPARLQYVGDDGWSVDWYIDNVHGLIVNPNGNSVGKVTRSVLEPGRGWSYAIQTQPNAPTVEAVAKGSGYATWQEAVLAAAPLVSFRPAPTTDDRGQPYTARITWQTDHAKAGT
jgi:hypothetical protein